MSILIASALRANTRGRKFFSGGIAPWHQDILQAFDEDGGLVAEFEPGTPLDVAIAMAKQHESQSVEDLEALVQLRAQHGDDDAIALLKKWAKEQSKLPAPQEIRAARTAAGLTQTAAAKLVHGTMRAWQDWEAGARRMHPGLWELFLIKTGKK